VVSALALGSNGGDEGAHVTMILCRGGPSIARPKRSPRRAQQRPPGSRVTSTFRSRRRSSRTSGRRACSWPTSG
jgi:hypothetical protein